MVLRGSSSPSLVPNPGLTPASPPRSFVSFRSPPRTFATPKYSLSPAASPGTLLLRPPLCLTSSKARVSLVHFPVPQSFPSGLKPCTSAPSLARHGPLTQSRTSPSHPCHLTPLGRSRCVWRSFSAHRSITPSQELRLADYPEQRRYSRHTFRTFSAGPTFAELLQRPPPAFVLPNDFSIFTSRPHKQHFHFLPTPTELCCSKYTRSSSSCSPSNCALHSRTRLASPRLASG